jgi:hypothetical protein
MGDGLFSYDKAKRTLETLRTVEWLTSEMPEAEDYKLQWAQAVVDNDEAAAIIAWDLYLKATSTT